MMKSILFVGLLTTSVITNAATLFVDDFESGLGQWTDTPNGTNAEIVADPLNTGRGNVLHFTSLVGGGDLVTNALIPNTTGGIYILSFDYLGTCNTNDCGGFVGASSDTTAANTTWLLGTQANQALVGLDDLDVWDPVSLIFNVSNVAGLSSGIHLVLEDWIGSGGVAGDAYFDNFQLTDANGPSAVPLPAAVWLLGSSLFGLALIRRKSIK